VIKYYTKSSKGGRNMGNEEIVQNQENEIIQENKPEMEVNQLISNLQDKVLSLIERYESLSKEKGSLSEEIENLKRENEELKEKVGSFEREIAERDKKEGEMKNKIVDLMETIESSIPSPKNENNVY
jgi:chromosome segregation ATPase